MTNQTNARLAGVTFLAYIATGIADMVLFRQVASGANIAAKLSNLAQHASAVRVCALLELLTFFEASTLAVTLYALTRDEDADIAMLAFACRLAEGVIGAVGALGTLRLASVVEAFSQGGADGAALTAFGASLLAQGGSSGLIGAMCFAVGSTLFAWLFLRARSIPVALAWLGILASALLVLALPLRLTSLLPLRLEWPIWIPMLAFEVTLALWLILKGTRPVRST